MSETRSPITYAGLVLLFTFTAACHAGYSGGLGTEAEPFRISVVSDWQELMATPADWASHFVLSADIDLNDIYITPIAPDTSTSSGFQGTLFTGVFDGNNFVIGNADVNMPGADFVGLFGYLGPNGQIKNLGAEDISIVGRYYVGGLVGFDYLGTVSMCYSTGSVSATGDYVAGLVGRNSGTITNCYSTGFVSGGDHVGGLVGFNYKGTVSNCYSTGCVSGTGPCLGGLVGTTDEAITGSFWDVNTSGRLGSSGGKGVTTERMKSVIIYRNAGWTGNGWVIEDGVDYPRLAWEGPAGVPIPEADPVPLLGDGTEENPYQIWTSDDFAILSWHTLILDKYIVLKGDIDLAGIPLYPIGDLGAFIGVFDGNGYDIRNGDVNKPGSDYVGLFGYLGTDGQIKNLGVEDVSIVGSNNLGGLVGRSHGTVSNCSSSGSVSGGDWDVGGLVGWNCEGTVTDCHSSGSVSGAFRVGALVGDNESGSVNKCYSTGSVTGGHSVGGLVGYNFEATISNCYSSGSVSGTGGLVGGVVGLNAYGTISNCCSTSSVRGAEGVGGLVGCNGETGENCYIGNCYSTGSVSGMDRVGGLVGSNVTGGTVSDCYSSGSVSGTEDYVGGLMGYSSRMNAVTRSFWDVNTSGWTTSDGGTPKTTGEMKTQSTFTLAGWDFVGETSNGTEDIWAICEGTNYPRLVWQIPAADWICPDGVGLEDFNYLSGVWGSADPSPANLDGEDGIGFGDLMIFCELWLSGR